MYTVQWVLISTHEHLVSKHLVIQNASLRPPTELISSKYFHIRHTVWQAKWHIICALMAI